MPQQKKMNLHDATLKCKAQVCNLKFSTKLYKTICKIILLKKKTKWSLCLFSILFEFLFSWHNVHCWHHDKLCHNICQWPRWSCQPALEDSRPLLQVNYNIEFQCSLLIYKKSNDSHLIEAFDVIMYRCNFLSAAKQRLSWVRETYMNSILP